MPWVTMSSYFSLGRAGWILSVHLDVSVREESWIVSPTDVTSLHVVRSKVASVVAIVIEVSRETVRLARVVSMFLVFKVSVKFGHFYRMH